MTSIKSKEEILRELKEKYESMAGKEISEEELIEKCLNFSNTHLDEFRKRRGKFINSGVETRNPFKCSRLRIISSRQDR